MRRTFSICTLTLGMLIVTRCGIALSQESEKQETNATDIAKPPTVRVAEPPKEITNSIGMKFKLIPAGEFMMGSSESAEELAKLFPGINPYWLKPDHFKPERPQHKVRITEPFYLGVTEVTQKQYEKVMGKNPSYFSKTGPRAARVRGMDTSSFPVENVSWDDAVEFCKELSAKERETYRLPTEAEWEYACRAGSETLYCFGDDGERLAEYAWFGDIRGKTHLVGEKKPNAWGLYDIHGNVWEWCSDWYGKDYYAKSPKDDPTGPATGSFPKWHGPLPQGLPAPQPGRVYRGGGHGDFELGCRSAARNKFPPSYRGSVLGFRVARGPIPTKPTKPPAKTTSDSR